ncbi:hypothetical protein B0H63DRAFT_478831 [Podospora didyma]|uniref:NYN domain-containing protein n=1 Tax=Podospora didyma TaxID=330526 RepID=A0AAE0KKB0_9PEZI|nr:hypothetical protein B0H63DRAFT_478831 [Podospora didyma]
MRSLTHRNLHYHHSVLQHLSFTIKSLPRSPPVLHKETTTKAKMDDNSQRICRFFIDDSNMWLEAKKFAALTKKLKDTSSDPRLRIDLGKLVNVISKGRLVGGSYLFGSRPPPNDSVWDAAKNRNFDVHVFDRSGSGNEKEVDNAMSTKMTAIATDIGTRARYKVGGGPEEQANTVFVVITGDRDMRPPVLEVLENMVHVELWAWESGLSKEFPKLANQQGHLSIEHLDSIYDKITFSNFRSTRKASMIDAARALVLSGFGEADLKTRKGLESSVCQKLLGLYRVFFVLWSKTSKDLIVEFPTAEKTEDFENIIQKTRVMFGQLTVVSAAEYFNQDVGTKLGLEDTGNMYGSYIKDVDGPEALVKAAQEEEKTEAKGDKQASFEKSNAGYIYSGKDEAGSHCNSNDNDGWEQVRKDHGPRHRREVAHTQRCKDGIHCWAASNCAYNHSEDERRLFQSHTKTDFRYWKSKSCNNPWQHGSKDCSYAHGEEDAWCIHCRCQGHLFTTCPYVYRGRA